jgi:thiaminase
MIKSQVGKSIMSERFTETLRAASEPDWSHAVGHRFVEELFAGAVPDVVMARYLIQDHRFLDCFLTLLGAVLASADTFEAKLRFARFIGMVSDEENTYFLRAFEALGVTDDRRAADPDMQPTAGFKAIMREAAETCSYAAALSVLVVAEWLYPRLGLARAEARYRTTSCTPSGSCCMTIPIFAASSISCARSWTGSALRRRISAATSSVGLSPSNFPSCPCRRSPKERP